MSQQEVLKILKKEDRPLSNKEIAKLLNQSPSTVSTNLKKLIKQLEVKKLENPRNWLIPLYAISKNE